MPLELEETLGMFFVLLALFTTRWRLLFFRLLDRFLLLGLLLLQRHVLRRNVSTSITHSACEVTHHFDGALTAGGAATLRRKR